MESELITLGVLFFFAIVGGVLAKKFNQPTVLALLLLGAIVGPNTLNIVSNQEWIDMIIEFGAILLLFVVGLEFNLSKLVRVGFKGITVAVLKVGLAFFIGFQGAVLFGFSTTVGIFSGAIISFSSTVVIIKVLEQKAMYNRQETPLLLTVLIIEDIFAIIALIFFSSLQSTADTSLFSMAEHMIIALTTLLVAYFILLHIATALFKWVIKSTGEDTSIMQFLALGFCAGFSALAYVLGLSPSAGAFLAGSIISSLPQSKSFHSVVTPYAGMASSLFFIAMGTMVNFSNIKPNISFILILLAAVFISRFLAVGLVSYVFAGFKGDQVFFSSLAMLSVGEFALLIAKQSSGFALGIDIVTITSVLIFVTAIFMSLSVAYSNSMNSLWNSTKTSTYLNDHISQLQWYVRNFFEQIDTENSETRRFKQAFFSTGITALLFAYVFVGWNKVIGLAQSFEVETTLLYLIHAGFALLAVLFLITLYKRIRYNQDALVRVLTGIDRMMNQRKSKRILKNLFLVAVFFFAAMFFPVVMYLFALPLWTNVISFVLLALSFVYFSIITRILNSYRSDSYTRGQLYNSISLRQLYKTAPKQFVKENTMR